MTDQKLEEERLQREIEAYLRVLKSRKDRDRELSEESKIPRKAVCLSNLQSPVRSHSEASKDEEKQMLDRVSSLLIRYGKEVLSS